MKITYYESINGIEQQRGAKTYIHKSTMKKEYRNICNAFQEIINISPLNNRITEEEFDGGRKLTVRTVGNYGWTYKEVSMYYKNIEEKPLPF